MLVEYTLNFKTLETHCIVVAMATYFPPRFLWKIKIFQINPSFFIIIFKARIKKNIRDVHKMSYTYHGCHGNIFPQFFLWKMKIFQINCLCFYIIFKVRIKQKYQECSQNVLHILSWLPWQHIFSKILVKNENFSNQAHLKKNIRNVKKMLYIYYHGCYGNIFFSKILVKNENFSKQAHFFYYYF